MNNKELASKELVGAMTLYDCTKLIVEIQAKADAHNGEIPEEEMKMLVEAQLQTPVKLKHMIEYIRHLDGGIESCKAEEKRIANLRKAASKRIESIEKYLTPYVKEKGKIDLVTFKLSTRRSTSVNLVDGFDSEFYCDKVESYVPNKKAIKEALVKGTVIPGAELEVKENLQVK